MKRLTLQEATGQALLSTVVCGEDTLLLFSGGVVRICTNYESHDISDYAEGIWSLDCLHRYDAQILDLLVAAGLIEGDQKVAAIAQRDAETKVWYQRREESLRKQYESLKQRFK